MVSPLSFRPLALLIKAVSTLAVLSDGRAWLDVGAGYLQDEADAMGLTMPPVTECFEELEETYSSRTGCGRRRCTPQREALSAGAPVRQPGAGTTSTGADRRSTRTTDRCRPIY
jgi:alkanesulfonate monooxygenase SsuD/methylene tetrahydromethanopterin reductase-like flavin-dependent oxidoreductase (luciferase family)